MKKIFAVFLCSFNFIFSEVYIPKNTGEEKVLKELRGKELKIGLSNDTFTNGKIIDDKSINDSIKSLLSDYLQLNVKYETYDFKKIYEKLEKKELDGVALMKREYERGEKFDFTKTIFSENLYVVSNKIKINSLNDLDGQEVYYREGTIYKNYLELLLKNNNLKVNYVQVKKLSDYKDELILTPNPVLYDPKYRIKVGYTSGSAIALNEEFSSLIPILNNALSKKYRKILSTKIGRSRVALSIRNFHNSLTEEEKNYLKSLKEIDVEYESEVGSVISYYSDKERVYKGIAPSILNCLGNTLNVKVNTVKSNGNKPDVMVFSRTMKREKDFIFTEKIYDIETYVVNLKEMNQDSRTIGVLNNSVEESIAEKYDIRRNIKKYETYDDMIEALDNKEVDNLLIAKNIFDYNKYNIAFFETAPVNFAFSKEDVLLRNIIDKGLKTLINGDKAIEKAILEKTNSELLAKMKEKEIKNVLISISFGLFIILFIIITKIILDNKHKKDLLKDPLSRLPNRSVFNDFCLKKAEEVSGYSFVIDIDEFKSLNDKYGHEFGDSIIKEFSNFLRERFQSSYIFRISGDEFYGVIVNTFEDIVSELTSYKLYCPLLEKYNISYSIGLHKKEMGTNINTSFKYADMALFKAKKIKGFSYELADKEFIGKKERELEILKLLEGDLNELYPVYQPKIKISTNEIIGAETLVRCKSRELGHVYPNELIPIAENFGLIYKIDYKMAEESVKFIRELMDSGKIKDDFRISFNVSVDTFSRVDLTQVIKDLLKRYNVPGKYIEVEVTESVLVKDIKDILTKLNYLIKLGVQISLDDFTAGHSTAGLLPVLPISIIKFDKSLLDSLDENEKKGQIIYKNLKSLVKGLNLKIVSEGIETKKQLEFLKEIGTDYGQGYLISKPKVYAEDEFFNIDNL